MASDLTRTSRAFGPIAGVSFGPALLDREARHLTERDVRRLTGPDREAGVGQLGIERLDRFLSVMMTGWASGQGGRLGVGEEVAQGEPALGTAARGAGV